MSSRDTEEEEEAFITTRKTTLMMKCGREGERGRGPTIGCMQFTNNTQTKTREREGEGLKAQWRGTAGRDPSNNWKIKMF